MMKKKAHTKTAPVYAVNKERNVTIYYQFGCGISKMVLKSKIFARINMLSFVFLKIPSMNVIPSKIGHDLTDMREKVV